MKPVRPHLTYANVLATACCLILLGLTPIGSVTASAAGDLSTQVAKALKLSKSANKRSNQALTTAQEALAKGGPAGPTGPQGPEGPQGPAGSADTGAQVLAKLLGVDGAGSSLDADRLDGEDGAAFQRRGTTTVCSAGSVVTSLGADGNVQCAPDKTDPTGAAGGALTGAYPNPTLKPPGPIKYIGTTNNPQFSGGWMNYSADYDSPAGYWIDQLGVVHLTGVITGGAANSQAFILPVTLCHSSGHPDAEAFHDLVFPASRPYPEPQTLTAVAVFGNSSAFVYGLTTGPISLAGIAFRACAGSATPSRSNDSRELPHP